jgi:sugar lactone lactonase YvrE
VKQLQASLALDARARLAEGPLWDARAGVLWWVDITGRAVHRFDTQAESDRAYPVPTEVGCVLLTGGPDVLVTLRETVGLLDPRSGAIAHLADLPRTVETQRTNDGAVDPFGNALIETMATDLREGGGSLLRLRPDGRLEHLLGGLTIPNGIAWTADASSMWFTDSSTHLIELIPYAPDGQLGARRTAFEVGRGIPDGLTTDADGRVWVAHWGGWGVGCYEPDGTLVTWVDVPCANVTSCTFGGPALDELYITTARDDVATDDLRRQPHAGGIFVARTGAHGRAADRFGNMPSR